MSVITHTESYWPSFRIPRRHETVHSILVAQAEHLRAKHCVPFVSVETSGDPCSLRFSLVAENGPTRLTLVTADVINGQISIRGKRVKTIADFKTKLRKVFSSKLTRALLLCVMPSAQEIVQLKKHGWA